MKFILYLSLCSFSNNTCFPPITYNEVFKDWNSCVIAGIDISIKVMKTLDIKEINKLKLSTQYSCEEQQGA